MLNQKEEEEGDDDDDYEDDGFSEIELDDQEDIEETKFDELMSLHPSELQARASNLGKHPLTNNKQSQESILTEAGIAK